MNEKGESTIKNYSRRKRKIHPALLVLALLAIFGVFWEGGIVSSPFVKHKHTEILRYMNEAYGSYLQASDEMNILLTLNNNDRSLADVQFTKRRISMAEETFLNAKVPKHFEKFHQKAANSFTLQNVIVETLQSDIAQRVQSNSRNVLIQKLNDNGEQAKVDIRYAFEKNRMRYSETEDGFVFWHNGDEERKSIKFN